jgi:hypothetical protein
MVDNKTQEIRAQDSETYSDMLEIADELPDSSPRFVLLSYPLTLVCSPGLPQHYLDKQPAVPTERGSKANSLFLAFW